MWKIPNKLFDACSSRSDVFIKFDESKNNASRIIDVISKWIISNRKSVGRSDANAASYADIANFMVNMPESIGNYKNICTLSQTLTL